MSLSEQTDSSYELKRIITLDSYSPGGETILCVEGGAIVTGENGAGKTSLIRLVPIFFGETARRITLGSLSFAEFYLARSTSYVIFEYSQRSELRLGVMYANASDANVQAFTYRFIRAPYSTDLFTTDDGKSLVPSDHLTTHLKLKNISFTRALSHDVYRSIIQGKVQAGKDAALYRSYVADYGFTSSGNRLDHIDRIVSGMFRRKADFDDFLRMVVGYISDKNEAFSISGDRGRLAEWPKQYAAYQRVMELGPLMERVLELDASIESEERQLSIVHAKLIKLAHHALVQSQKLMEASQLRTKELNEASAHFMEADELLSRNETNYRNDAEAQEKLGRQLDQAKAAFEKEGIEDKVALVAALPTIDADIASTDKRKEAILGARNEIDRKYEALKQNESKLLQERKDGLLSEKELVTQQHEVRLEAYDQSQDPLETEIRSRHEALINSLRAELAIASSDLAVATSQASNPIADPEIIQRLATKITAREQAHRALTEPRSQLAEATRRVAQTKQDFEHQETKIARMMREVDHLEQVIASLKRQSVPDANSLLAFLRNEYPNWAQDIAKVINEPLLARTDLDPSMVDGVVQALYGVSIDLSKIESPMVADAGLLLAEIAAHENRKTDLKKTLADEHLGLERLGAKLEEMRSLEEAARLAFERTEAAHNTAIDEERATRNEEGRSKQKNQQALEQQKADLQVKRIEKDSALSGAINAMELDLTRQRTETKAGRHRLLSEKQAAIAAITKRICDDEAGTQAKIMALDAERVSALAADGVDMKALKLIESDLRALEARASAARKAQPRVAAWSTWLNNEWTQRQDVESRAQKARSNESDVKSQRQAAQNTWSERRNALQTEIALLSGQSTVAGKLSSDADTMISRLQLERYPVDQATELLAYDPVWTLEHLAAQANKANRDRGIAFGDLRSRVNEIKRAFRASAGTATGDYFASLQLTVDPDDDRPRAWITPFKTWFDVTHKENQRILLVEAREFGKQIIAFHRDIDAFSKRIHSFNRDMQNALDQTEVFSRISSIQIHFNSTISTKAYWPAINDFIRNNESWIHNQLSDSPPSSFATDLERLLEHWDVREGVRAERQALIDVSGEVVENGVQKRFRDSKSLGLLSSNGLSYLILTVIFVAFLRMIRGNADVRVTYAVDELGDLDIKNIGILVEMLRKNGVSLVSACPGADLSVLTQFKNRYRVQRDHRGPELVEIEVENLEADYV